MSYRLIVYLGQRLVGELRAEPGARGGGFSFAYDAGWVARPDAVRLSVSLPLRGPESPYPFEAARPFFAGLLPEGAVRTAVARRHGISEGNEFALLAAIGAECAGAVALLRPGESPPATGDYRELPDEELARWLTGLPRGLHLGAGVAEVRLSLAGAQDKLPVYIEETSGEGSGEGRLLLPLGGAPSSHILKPEISDYPETVENEALCLALAARAGLPTAPARIRTRPVRLLEVTRFDRRRDADTLVRVHQEDLAQALGVPPEAKYETEGGPGLGEAFRLLGEQSVAPAVDRKALLGWVAFNVLVGNTDAHAKNLSFLHEGGGLRLAPFYDLLATQVYPGLSDKLAMKVGGEARPAWLQRRHWERLAEQAQIRPRFVLDTVRGLAEVLPELARQVVGEHDERWGPAPIRRQMVAWVEATARRILRRLEP